MYKVQIIINSWPKNLKEELKHNPFLLNNVKEAAKKKHNTTYWSFPSYRYDKSELEKRINEIKYKEISLKEYCIDVNNI